VKLTEYLESIAYDIGFWLTAFQNPDYPVRQLGEISEQVTAKTRAAAIIVLLTKGDTDAFYHNLMRSARARAAYLRRLRDEGIDGDHHQGSGRFEPFLDAVAAADFRTAREIAALSPRQWLQGHEYEDDFCFAQILHELITVPTDTARLAEFFTRFERVLDGQPEARLDVTRALAARDQAEFDQAFERLIAQRTRQIEHDQARQRIEEPVMIAERSIFIEGLALLQIATRLGLVTQDDYAYCPSIARVPMQQAFPGE
jgi:hypothetical protein